MNKNRIAVAIALVAVGIAGILAVNELFDFGLERYVPQLSRQNNSIYYEEGNSRNYESMERKDDNIKNNINGKNEGNSGKDEVVRQEASKTYIVKVNTKKIEGEFKDLLGVNKSPLFTKFDGGEIDFSAGYKSVGVNEVRMHDDDLDICKIYGKDSVKSVGKDEGTVNTDKCRSDEKDHHYVWNVDEGTTNREINAVENYNFVKTDEKVHMINDIEAKVYLRLGESWQGPNDVKKGDEWAFAKIGENIYKHYAGDFGDIAFKPEISAVEVHNEADGRMFWRGSNETYYKIVRETLENLQKVGAKEIGGSGFVSGINKQFSGEVDGELVQNYIAEVGSENLDFFSAHYYGECRDEKLSNLATWITELRENIDKRGMKGKPLHITEWNLGTGLTCTDGFNTPHMFTYTTGALLLMQDLGNITHAHFYSGQGSSMAMLSLNNKTKDIVLGKILLSFNIHKKFKGSKVITSQICNEDGTVCTNESLVDDFMAKAFKTKNGYSLMLVNDSAEVIDVDIAGLIKAEEQVKVTTYKPQENPYLVKSQGDCIKERCIFDAKSVDDYIDQSTMSGEIWRSGDGTKNIFTVQLQQFSVSVVEV